MLPYLEASRFERKDMEIARSFLERHPTRFRAYLSLQVALMRRFVARGGTSEEFCSRLAPVFHRRYAPLLLHPVGTSPENTSR